MVNAMSLQDPLIPAFSRWEKETHFCDTLLRERVRREGNGHGR